MAKKKPRPKQDETNKKTTKSSSLNAIVSLRNRLNGSEPSDHSGSDDGRRVAVDNPWLIEANLYPDTWYAYR